MLIYVQIKMSKLWIKKLIKIKNIGTQDLFMKIKLV